MPCSIASKVSWRHLWDIALEKGVKGTKIIQSLFREVCCPASCFQWLLYKPHLPTLTVHVFEHACEQHPIQFWDLSWGGYLLTPSLKEKQTQFFHLFKVGKLYITVGTALQITQWLHVYAYCLSTSLYCLYLCVLLVTSYCNVLSQMPLGHCHEYYYVVLPVDYSNKLWTFNLLLSFDWVASSDSAVSLKKVLLSFHWLAPTPFHG